MKANWIVPSVDIELGGDVYEMRLDMVALAKFQRETGVNLLTADKNYSFEPAHVLAGIRLALAHKVQLTVEEFDTLVSGMNVTYLYQKISEAYVAMLVAEGTEKNGDPDQPNGSGPNDSQST